MERMDEYRISRRVLMAEVSGGREECNVKFGVAVKFPIGLDP